MAHPAQRSILTGLILAVSLPGMAQLAVNNTLFPTQLVQNVLLGGGVTATNITFNGGAGNILSEQIGSFDGTASNIGLDAGVLMGTGDVQLAPGPNENGGGTEGGGNFGAGDADLTELSGVSTNDAAVLEFDFVPTGDSLKFRYVFSSEEYDEYVCGTVNDAFGFFLSGPGITGPFTDNAINIALVPGTQIPVSINTVNIGVAGANAGGSQNCEDLDANWEANSIYYQSNASGTTVEYDGFTVVLTAFALVQCGQQYHIKMAIADGGDTAFDSGVFLEAGSFTSTGQVQPILNNGFGANGDVMLEGCGPYELVFTRLGDLGTVDTVNYVIGGTATSGVDFLPGLPAQMVFEEGVESITVTLDVPFDADGAETVVINVEQLVECAGIVVETIFTFTIDSPAPLDVVMDDIDGNCGETHVLTPQVTGGMGEYLFTWSTGETSPSITVSPGTTTTYYYTITDACAVVPWVDSVTVTLPVYLPVEIEVSPATPVACLDTEPIAVTSATGGDGVYTYAWTVNGAAAGTTATITVPSGPPTYYTVVVEDGCGFMDMDSVLVTTIPLDPIEITTTGDQTVVCPGDTAELAIAGIVGGNGVYFRTWTNSAGDIMGNGNFIEVPVPVSSTYTITVADQCGTIGSTTVDALLAVYAPFVVSLPPDMVLCAGDSVELRAAVSGGTGLYTITWADSIHSDPIRWELPLEDATYMVTARDRCGEERTDAVRVEVEHVDVGFVVTNRGEDDWYLQAATTPYAQTWVWDMGDGTRYRGHEVEHSYLDIEDHWVTLSVVTPNGCVGMDSILIEPPAHLYFPNAFTPDGDGINDTFGPQGNNITEFSISIFDRWGELVYSAEKPGMAWDGSIQGEEIGTTGVYVYKYRAVGLYFAPVEGFGQVTLLKGSTNSQ